MPCVPCACHVPVMCVCVTSLFAEESESEGLSLRGASLGANPRTLQFLGLWRCFEIPRGQV
jgi:hypothetical protein